MINADIIYSNMINSVIRQFRGRVELYEGSTLTLTCGCHDHLKDFSIERIGEGGKFFGFGTCQKMTTHLLDKDRAIQAEPGMIMETVFGIDTDYMYPFPKFVIAEVTRDENTNELTLVGYDPIYEATKATYADLGMGPEYTVKVLAIAVASYLGLPLKIENVDDTCFDIDYPNGGNFAGTETLREVLNAIAEVTQTVYFVNHDWELTFKRLDRSGSPVVAIDKTKYFELKGGAPQTLTKIVHTTELGDNVYVGSGDTVQYIRDNPLWNLRTDVGDRLQQALTNSNGTTITPFNCNWRGNFLVEFGDKISLTAKDDTLISSYLLNDTIKFNGALSQTTQWDFEASKEETEANPATLGQALNQTFARVDKVNQRIDLVASSVDANNEKIAQLEITTDSINASVSRVQETTTEAFGNVNGEIATLTNKVNAAMTAEDVTIQVQQQISNGVDKVVTSTGFTFDHEGLMIEKSGAEMKTQITEDGMRVFRDNTEVLDVNNTGVYAENLHATTYLMIGKNSRFEDYLDNRTGCFFIG